MTKTRVLAALIMAPVAIAAILLLPTQWLAAAAAAVLLIGLWEWLKLAGIEDTLARTVLLVLNLLLMVLLVWADGSTLVLFQITTLAGVAWWLAALVWLRFFNFGAQPSAPSDREDAGRHPGHRARLGRAGADPCRRRSAGQAGPPVAAGCTGTGLGGRFGRLFRRPPFRQAQAGAADQPQQDLGRPVRRPAGRCRRGPRPGLAGRHRYRAPAGPADHLGGGRVRLGAG
jgi:hypothetical protein